MKQGCQVIDAVVDHEIRGAWCKVIAACGADRPDGCSLRGITCVIRPTERSTAPFLHVNAEMLLVPSVQPDGISRLKEDSPDACDSLHLTLRDVNRNWSVAYTTPNDKFERRGGVAPTPCAPRSIEPIVRRQAHRQPRSPLPQQTWPPNCRWHMPA